MAVQKHRLPNHFRTGQISPALDARADWQKRADALRLARNVSIEQQGGVRKRPGLIKVGNLPSTVTLSNGETVEGIKYTRLFPWYRNTESSFTVAQSDKGVFRILSANPVPGQDNGSLPVEGRGPQNIAENTRQFSADAVSVFVDGTNNPYTIEVDTSNPLIRENILLTTGTESSLINRNFAASSATATYQNTKQGFALTDLDGSDKSANLVVGSTNTDIIGVTTAANSGTYTNQTHTLSYLDGTQSTNVGVGDAILTSTAGGRSRGTIRMLSFDNAGIVPPIGTVYTWDVGANISGKNAFFDPQFPDGNPPPAVLFYTAGSFPNVISGQNARLELIGNSNFSGVREVEGTLQHFRQSTAIRVGSISEMNAAFSLQGGFPRLQTGGGRWQLTILSAPPPTTQGTPITTLPKGIEGLIINGKRTLPTDAADPSSYTFDFPNTQTTANLGIQLSTVRTGKSTPNYGRTHSGPTIADNNGDNNFVTYNGTFYDGANSIVITAPGNTPTSAVPSPSYRYRLEFEDAQGNRVANREPLFSMPGQATISTEGVFGITNDTTFTITIVPAITPNELPLFNNYEFSGMAAERLSNGEYQTVELRGNEAYRLNGSTNTFVREPMKFERRIVALYSNDDKALIDTSRQQYFLGYSRIPLALVQSNTHNIANLLRGFSGFGQFRTQDIQFTYPPMRFLGVPGTDDAAFNAEVARVGADYCINLANERVAFWGPEVNSIPNVDIDIYERQATTGGGFNASRVDTNFLTPELRARLNTQTKLNAERVKSQFKLRQATAGSDDLYKFPGYYTMVWNNMDGFPRAVAAWDTRLIFGGTTSLPNYIWPSVENRGFEFLDRSRNFSTLITVTEANSIIDTNFAFQYQLDKADTIENIYASNSLIIFAQNSENILSGRLTASGLDWLRSQSSSTLGTRGNVGLAEIDKKIFIHNSETATALQYISDEEGYRNINLSNLWNDSIFLDNRMDVPGQNNTRLPNINFGKVDPVIRVQGGLIADARGAYQVFYQQDSGNTKVFNTLQDAEFFAWCEWDYDFAGTTGAERNSEGQPKKLIDISYNPSTRRMFALDNDNGYYIFDWNCTHDEFIIGTKSPIDCRIQTVGFGSFEIPGGGGIQWTKRVNEVHLHYHEFSQDSVTTAAERRDRVNEVILRCGPDDGETNCKSTPEELKDSDIIQRTCVDIDTAGEVSGNVGSFSSSGVQTAVDGRNNRVFEYDVSRGGRVIEAFGAGVEQYDYVDNLTVEVRHKGIGPFVLNRIVTTVEFEVAEG